jgi:choline kinase
MEIQLLRQKKNKKDLIAIILSAGEGTRIKGNIDDVPKSLIRLKRLNNKPILYDIIYKLLKLNILKSIIIITGHLERKIKSFLVSLKKNDSSILNSINIHNSKKEYKKGPLYSFLSLVQYRNTLLNQQLIVLPGDTIFDFELLKNIISIINSYEASCTLFYRESTIKSLNDYPKNELSILDVEEHVENIIVKRISQLHISSYDDTVILKQLIPIISIDSALLGTMSEIAEKFKIKTLRDIINKLIEQKMPVTAHRVDSAYKFYDIDTIEDKNNFEHL